MRCAASAGCTSGQTITKSGAARSGSISSAIWSIQRPVALGVTAARSLTGRTLTIGKVRGKPIAMADGSRPVVTLHPSALLRIEDDEERHAAYRSFVADLKAAASVRSRALVR